MPALAERKLICGCLTRCRKYFYKTAMPLLRKNKSSRISNIHVAPYASIVCVLVVIQMLFNLPYDPLKYKQEVFVLRKLPYDAASGDGRPDRLIIKVSKEQEIDCANKLVAFSDLEAQVKKHFGAFPPEKRNVLIKASKELSYDFVVQVIDIAKAAQVMRVELQIDFLDNQPL
jgi:biopolymer transport protein ExbD